MPANHTARKYARMSDEVKTLPASWPCARRTSRVLSGSRNTARTLSLPSRKAEVEEVEQLDIELTENIAKIRAGIEGIETGKDGAEFDPAGVQRSLEAARALFQSLKVEMRELERDALAAFEPKARAHQSTLEELGRNLNLAKSVAERKALVGERAARAAEEITPAEAAGPRGGNAHEIIEMAKKTQAEDQEGMNRMLRMVENSETVGKETNLKLKMQTEQLKAVQSDVRRVTERMKAADKLLNQIGRTLMTDKCLACLIVVLLVVMLGVIVAKMFGLGKAEEAPGGYLAIDCSWEFNAHIRECRELKAQQEVAAAAAAAESNGGGGSRRVALGPDR